MKKTLLPVLIALCLVLGIKTPTQANSNRTPTTPEINFRRTAPAIATIHPVDIETGGFDPWEITIEGGDSITWTNQTTQTVTLEEGIWGCLYLPLINQTSTVASASLPPNGAPHHADGVEILPDGIYTRAFPSEGTFYFYLPNHLCRSMMVTVRNLPDLEVRSVTLDPNPAAQSSSVGLETEIHNLGAGVAGAFTVGWELTPLGQPTPVSSGSWNVGGLGAGASTTLTTTLTATSPGPYMLEVTADPTSQIQDEDPSNNSDEAELGVTGTMNVCGDVSSNTTWAYATYVLTCNVDILSGATLTVRSAAVVKPQSGGIGMQVHGSLLGTGTGTIPVVFTSYKDDIYGGDTNGDGVATSPAAGDWSSIFILTGGTTSFTHAVVRYGSVPIQNHGGTVALDATTIEHGSGNGVNSDTNGAISIQDSLIRNNNGYGLYYVASGTAAPVIRNNIFQSNTGYAIYFSLTGDLTLDGTGMSGNTATNNGTNGLRLAGTLTGTSTLGRLGIPYVLEEHADRIGSIYIPASSMLAIQPGAVLKGTGSSYWNGKGTGLEVLGVLSATGTVDQPIVFTSIRDDAYGGDTNNDANATSPAPGDWTRLIVGAGGSANFDHAIIRYSGGGVHAQSQESIRNEGGALTLHNSTVEFGSGTGVRSYSNGTLDVQDSLIQNNGEHGLLYSASGSVMPIIKNNSFVSNTSYAIYFSPSGELNLDGTQMSGNIASTNGANGLRLVGTLTGTSTLRNPGMAFVLEEHTDRIGSIYVPAGSTLTIQPGAVFKGLPSSFWNGKGTGLEIAGNVSAVGLPGQPIIFTSLRDDTYSDDTNNDGSSTAPAPGDWTRLIVGAGGSANFDHTIIRYSGGGVHAQSQESIRNEGGALTLHNSTVEFGSGTGVRSYSNGTLDVQDSLIQGNGEHGLLYSASGSVMPIIKNNSFVSNTSYAIYFSPSGELNLDGTQISGNTTANNGTNGLRLVGTLTGTSTLRNPGMAFVLEEHTDRIGSIYVPAGSTLTIQPGAVFKGLPSSFWNGKGTGLEIAGNVSAVGLPGQPIIFTSLRDDTYSGDTNNDGSSTAPAPGDWTRLIVGAGGSANFDHTIIRYSGGGVHAQSQESIRNEGGALTLHNSTVEFGSGTGVRSYSNGTLDVQDSLIQNNTEYGLFFSASGPAAPVIKNNTFQNNTSYAVYFSPSGELTLDGTQISGNIASTNGANGLRLAGTLTGVSTLRNPGMAFVLEEHTDRIGSIYVPAGSTLTIQPGAVFKGLPSSFWNGKGTGLEVLGVLSATGTVDQPIVFTSIRDDTYSGDTNNDGSSTAPAPGDWTRLIVGAGGSANFDHAIIRYSGGGVHAQSQESIRDNGAVSLVNSTVEYSGDVGVRLDGGMLGVQSSVFSHNPTGILLGTSTSAAQVLDSDFLANTTGINFTGNYAPTVNNCILEGNTSWGLYNSTGLAVTATGNWWGNTSGPTNPSNPGGTGDPVGGAVTFSPWLTSRPR